MKYNTDFNNARCTRRILVLSVLCSLLLFVLSGCTAHSTSSTASLSTEATTASPAVSTPTPSPSPEPTPTPEPPSDEHPVIALTFDDGPSVRDTGKLLDLLAEENVQVTFFVLGNQIESGRESLLIRAFDEGHEIANHTYSHLTLTEGSDSQVRDELMRTNQLIQDITGQAPSLMRPPLGAYNDITQSVCLELGLSIVSWSWQSCPEDWNLRGKPDEISGYVITHAANGHIVLLHDTNSSTIEAMPAMIKGLKDQGFRFMTVSDLLSYQGEGYPQPGDVYFNLSS